MDGSRSRDVIVVGAGAVGSAVARELATGDEAPFDTGRFGLDRLPDSVGFEPRDTSGTGHG